MSLDTMGNILITGASFFTVFLFIQWLSNKYFYPWNMRRMYQKEINRAIESLDYDAAKWWSDRLDYHLEKKR